MTKKIWMISISSNEEFADLSRHYQEPEGKRCVKCNCIVEPKRNQLIVEWDEGSERVGDFVHAGIDLIVQDRVAKQLLQIASGFVAAPITFFDHPNLRKPVARSRTKRIWLPYEGPDLLQLVVLRRVPILERSTVSVDFHCKTCGTIRYKEIKGVQKGPMAQRGTNEGLFIEIDELHGDDVFSPIGMWMTLCTDKVKEFIMKMGYSNVDLLEYGELV